MRLYTIVLDYSGGTYVAQTLAADENAALCYWISSLKLKRSADAVSEEIAAAFEATEACLVPLDGLAGVWCSSANAVQGPALVNVVKTAT